MLSLFQTGKYQDYTEFHSDMLLVKSNCLKYNPPGHDIRQVSIPECMIYCRPGFSKTNLKFTGMELFKYVLHDVSGSIFNRYL